VRPLLAKESAPQTTGAPETRTNAADEDAHWLACARCRHRVTSHEARCERFGRHEHLRANPSGFMFVFGCFARAPGAELVGPPTDDATWFAGYRWSYALCASCAAHLGWHFDGDAPFFGLVLDRLVEVSTPSA
jgi:hypothetical protein